MTLSEKAKTIKNSYSKEWYHKNREEVLRKRKEWYLQNKDRAKGYVEKMWERKAEQFAEKENENE